MQRWMCLNSDIHSRALFIQIPEFCQAGDNMFDACASMNLLWSEIHMTFSVVMSLHLYSAVHKDAVASKHAGSFVSSSTRERAPLG